MYIYQVGNGPHPSGTDRTQYAQYVMYWMELGRWLRVAVNGNGSHSSERSSDCGPQWLATGRSQCEQLPECGPYSMRTGRSQYWVECKSARSYLGLTADRTGWERVIPSEICGRAQSCAVVAVVRLSAGRSQWERVVPKGGRTQSVQFYPTSINSLLLARILRCEKP